MVAYLQGAFLASGYVSDARNKNYHLEFSLSDKTYALWLSHLINKALDGNFDSKIVERRKKSVVYFKKGEKISEFLVYLRAQQSCLEFESIRVDRDFANIGNRLRNLDGANTSQNPTRGNRISFILVCLFPNPKSKDSDSLRIAKAKP